MVDGAGADPDAAAAATAELKAVTATLQSFKAARDWPDFIHSLQQLNGILSSSSGRDVPAKHTVAKRLAQGCAVGCSPSVHAKVLEVYATIFARIGADQLVQDLPLYSLGLLPMLENASPTNKPSVVQLLQQHYLPLRERLEPCLPGLVAVLTAELHDPSAAIAPRLIALLVDIGENVGLDVLYDVFWDCLRWSPHTRPGALYFLREQKGTTKNWSHCCALATAHSTAAVAALCECLGDAKLEVQSAAARLIEEGFPLKHCVEMAPDDGACVGQPPSSPSPQVRRLATGMLLLLRQEHDGTRQVAMAWFQDALPRTLGDSEIAPPACERAAAAVVATLEALLTQSPQVPESVAHVFHALSVLMGDLCSRQHLLPRLCPALVRRLNREFLHSQQAGLNAFAKEFLIQLSHEAVWAALAERWECEELDVSIEADLLATALGLMEASVLTVEDERTQHHHLPSLLANVCGRLEPSNCPQSDATHDILGVGLQLARSLLDRSDDWLHAAKTQITAAQYRCERFLLWFVRTHVTVDFTRLRYRRKRSSGTHATFDRTDMWVLQLLKNAYQLTTKLHQHLTRMGCKNVHGYAEKETSNANAIDQQVHFDCTRDYEWIAECATRAESVLVQAAIATEATLSPVWLSLLHCIDAHDTGVAWFAFKAIIATCDGPMDDTSFYQPCIANIMAPSCIFGTAVVRRAWDFLPSSVQVDVNINDLRWEAQGDTAVVQWCQLQRLFPELCSVVVQTALTDTGSYSSRDVSEPADGYADVRMAHFRRYGLLCAVAFHTSDDLLETLHCGVLPMLAACTDPHSQARGCALMWLRWVIRTGLSWLLHILVVALANAHAADDARAAYILSLVKLIISDDEFFRVASVHPAPHVTVAAAQGAGIETSSGTWLRLVADLTLSVARTAIEVKSAHVATLGSAALDCLIALASLTVPHSHEPLAGASPARSMQAVQAATDLHVRLIDPCLTLLTSSVQHPSTELQMQLLSLVRAVIRACAERPFNEDKECMATHSLDVRQGRLEVSMLTGLRHPHVVDSPLLQQWLGLAMDAIASVEKTRASTLRAVTGTLVDLLNEAEGVFSSTLTSSSRTFVLMRALADMVDLYLRGLVDLSAESLPADAFAETKVTKVEDASESRGNGATGLWGWRALVSSVAGVEEAEDVPLPPPQVQTAVVVLQALPAMVASCVATWGTPEHASGASPQRAEVARLFSTVWLARPFALFAAVLQWWLGNCSSESKPTSHRVALIEMLHKFGATAGEVLTVGCKVLHQLYSVTKEDSGSNSAVELKWSQLLALPLAEVQPGWTSLMTAFITHPPTACSTEIADQLKNAWPDLREVVHDSLHTALVAFHGPLPPALLLLRLLEAFIARIGSVSEEAERKSVQDLTQRLVGQCLAVLPNARSGGSQPGKTVHTQSCVRASVDAAQLLGLQPCQLFKHHIFMFSTGAPDSKSAANAVGLLTLRWLGRHLPAICNIVWAADESTLVSTLDGFVGPVIRQLNADESDRMPELQLSAATFIAAFAENCLTLAVWRPSVTSLLQRGEIFHCSAGTLAALRPAVSAIFKEDQTSLLALLAPGHTASSALERASSFTFKRSSGAMLEREAGLQRLTYALWCGAVGQHRAALPNLVAALVEAIEQYEDSNGGADGPSSLLVAVFLCMRAIALRVAPSDLAPFWSLASAEMLKVFVGGGRADDIIVAAAKKLLVLFRTLRPAAFLDVFVALSPGDTENSSVEIADHEPASRRRVEHLERLQLEGGSIEVSEFPSSVQNGTLTTIAEAEQSIINELANCETPERHGY